MIAISVILNHPLQCPRQTNKKPQDPKGKACGFLLMILIPVAQLASY